MNIIANNLCCLSLALINLFVLTMFEVVNKLLFIIYIKYITAKYI